MSDRERLDELNARIPQVWAKLCEFTRMPVKSRADRQAESALEQAYARMQSNRAEVIEGMFR